MVKSEQDVLNEFNEYVNMTQDELQAWLDDPESDKAGLGPGKESGHKIVDILSRNPSKDPEKYTDADKEHMRRVAAYCKRHLAQEGHMKDQKSEEELKHTKSTISLKNWGHDPLKGSGNDAANKGKADSSSSKKATTTSKKQPAKKAGSKRKKDEQKEEEAEEDEEDEEEEAEEPRDDADDDEAAVEEENTGETAQGEAEDEEPPTKKAKATK